MQAAYVPFSMIKNMKYTGNSQACRHHDGNNQALLPLQAPYDTKEKWYVFDFTNDSNEYTTSPWFKAEAFNQDDNTSLGWKCGNNGMNGPNLVGCDQYVGQAMQLYYHQSMGYVGTVCADIVPPPSPPQVCNAGDTQCNWQAGDVGVCLTDDNECSYAPKDGAHWCCSGTCVDNTSAHPTTNETFAYCIKTLSGGGGGGGGMPFSVILTVGGLLLAFVVLLVFVFKKV